MSEARPVAPALGDLVARFPRDGRLDWIGVRPERRGVMRVLDEASVGPCGLDEDRHARPNGRAITLIQAEHLPVIAALADLARIAPETLRRNLVVSGLNLAALRGWSLQFGSDVRLRLTGPCAPCSRMEEALGCGGYNAMRGHGGWTAEVVAGGRLVVGEAVRPVRD